MDGGEDQRLDIRIISLMQVMALSIGIYTSSGGGAAQWTARTLTLPMPRWKENAEAKPDFFFFNLFKIYSCFGPPLLEPEGSSMHIFTGCQTAAGSCCHVRLLSSTSSQLVHQNSSASTEVCTAMCSSLQSLSLPPTTKMNAEKLSQTDELFDHTL